MGRAELARELGGLVWPCRCVVRPGVVSEVPWEACRGLAGVVGALGWSRRCGGRPGMALQVWCEAWRGLAGVVQGVLHLRLGGEVLEGEFLQVRGDPPGKVQPFVWRMS